MEWDTAGRERGGLVSPKTPIPPGAAGGARALCRGLLSAGVDRGIGHLAVGSGDSLETLAMER